MPVIACIEWDAVGPGLEWILACDLRIASETSRFALPHVKIRGHALLWRNATPGPGGGIAEVTLNRPEALNAYNIRMRDDLYEVLGAIRDDD